MPGSRASQSSAEASSPSICPASDRPYQSAAFAAALSPVPARPPKQGMSSASTRNPARASSGPIGRQSASRPSSTSRAPMS